MYSAQIPPADLSRVRYNAAATMPTAIRDFAVFPVREPSGREYVVVKVTAEDGVVGWGEAPAAGGAKAAAERFSARREALLELDPSAAEPFRRAVAALEPELAGAADAAALDILGKRSKAPAYEALAGRTRDKVRAIAVLSGPPERLAEQVRQASQAGFRAFAVPLPPPEGPTRGREFFVQTRELLERLREAGGGDDADFVLDCDSLLRVGEAAALAAVLEPFHLLWMDEPNIPLQDEAARKISEESVTPVGRGRRSTAAQFQDLLRMQIVDVLRPNVAALGVRPARQAAALAEAYYVAVSPYHRGGPVGLAAAIHTAASTPNSFSVDVPWGDEQDRAMRRELAGVDFGAPEEGFLPLPTGPGLGVEIDEEALRRYAA